MAATASNDRLPSRQSTKFGQLVVTVGNCVVRSDQQHEPVRLAERQRPQQHGVDDGEDRGVGADAEGQGEHGHGREARPGQEDADRVSEVSHITIMTRACPLCEVVREC